MGHRMSARKLQSSRHYSLPKLIGGSWIFSVALRTINFLINVA